MLQEKLRLFVVLRFRYDQFSANTTKSKLHYVYHRAIVDF